MGFINKKKQESSIYLKLGQQQLLVRPLWREPISYWNHWIPKVTRESGNKNEVVRNGGSEPCNEDGHCVLCKTPDPLWNDLTPRDKFSQKGERKDFTRSLQHGLPVWDYASQTIKILSGGNQLFENMDEADDAGIDIAAYDWTVWKTEENGQTKYKSQKMDATPVQFQVSQDEVDMVVQKFRQDNIECDTAENILTRIGVTTDAGTMQGQQLPPSGFVPQFQQPQVQQQLPQPQNQQFPPFNIQQQVPQMSPQQMQVPPMQVPQGNVPGVQVPPVNVPQAPTQPMHSTAPNVQTPQIQQQPPAQMMQPAMPAVSAPVASPSPQMKQPVPQQPQQTEATPVASVAQESMSQRDVDLNMMISSGKYSGRSLEWLMQNDQNYFNGLGSFMKNYPDLVEASNRLKTNSYPAVQNQGQSAVQQVQQVQQPVQQTSESREELVQQVTNLFTSRSDLWLGSKEKITAMADFCTQHIGKPSYADLDVDQLKNFISVLQQHHGQNPQV